jgi:hypothetical protein
MLADCHMPTCIPSVSFADNTPAPATRPSAQVPVTDPSGADDSEDNHPPAVPPPPWWQGQIDFSIPLSKVSKCHEDYEVMFPPGSLFNP